jgi:hypothetical protein
LSHVSDRQIILKQQQQNDGNNNSNNNNDDNGIMQIPNTLWWYQGADNSVPLPSVS